MTETMTAFFGDAGLKDGLLAELAKHRAADQIVQGHYWDSDLSSGCAVGCAIDSLTRLKGLALDEDDHGNHTLYETHFGISRALARIEDGIFEGLPVADAKLWPERFTRAIRPGADLSMVVPKFLHWLLTTPDGPMQRQAVKYPSIKPSIDAVGALYQRWIAGTKPSDTEWREARKTVAAAVAVAAAAAAAAYAAVAVAAAAYAAYKHARQGERQRQADYLVTLLEAS